MPIFKAELIDKILAGEKTQTRRPKKDGDTDTRYLRLHGPDLIDNVIRKSRLMWEVGRDYAIVPGRGKPAIEDARIRITRIRQEDARDISHEDVLAEGFQDIHEFLAVWCGFYDPVPLNGTVALDSRPDALYQCWALDFEVVRL